MKTTYRGYKPLPEPIWRDRLRMDADSLHAAAQRLRTLTLREAPVPITDTHIGEMIAPHVLTSASGALDQMADAFATIINLARHVDALEHHLPTLERVRHACRDASNSLEDLATIRRTETDTPETL